MSVLPPVTLPWSQARRSVPIPGSPSTWLGGLSPLCAAAAALLALEGSRRGLGVVLVVLQTVLVMWLGALSWSPERAWARAGVLMAGAWTLTLLIPSWIFAINPGLLPAGSVDRTGAMVDLSLVCFISGYVWLTRVRAARAPVSVQTQARVRPTSLNPRRLVGWSVLGILGFTALFAMTGGPVHFIANVSNEGAMTRGRTYFLFAGIALLWVAQVLVYARWAGGRSMGARRGGFLLITLGLVTLLGARVLLAVPLVELTLFYSLVRRRLSTRTVGCGVLAALFVVVFALGVFKRYGNYLVEHPGTRIGRLQYAFTKGPGSFASSYATATADGIVLIARAETVVPGHAHPEYGKEALRLMAQILPSEIRPTVHTAPAIQAAFYPSPDRSYAQPLQLVGYLQFGLPGMIVALLLAGVGVAAIDHALVAPGRLRLSTLVLDVALTASAALTLRDAAANAVADTIIQVVGLWLVARTVERRSSELQVDGSAR